MRTTPALLASWLFAMFVDVALLFGVLVLAGGLRHLAEGGLIWKVSRTNPISFVASVFEWTLIGLFFLVAATALAFVFYRVVRHLVELLVQQAPPS